MRHEQFESRGQSNGDAEKGAIMDGGLGRVKKLKAEKLELERTRQELTQTRAQYDELRHQMRLNRHTDTERIQSEKDTREELQHLHKELRQMEHKLKSETAHHEAKLKACQDSLQRAAEKCHSLQRKLDQADNEKMGLKIETQRLTRKLGKAGSEAEKKRLQMEIESQAVEIAVLKRKLSKLEKCLDNTVAAASTATFSFSDTPSESRALHIERELEVVELDGQNKQLADKNRALLDELAETKKRADKQSLGAELVDSLREQLTLASSKENEMILKIKTLEEALKERKQALDAEQSQIVQQEVNEMHLQELQERNEKLQKSLTEKDIEMGVRLKEMRATTDELSGNVQELEMEKLRTELGELKDEEKEDEEEEDDESREAELVEELHAEIQCLKENVATLQSNNSSKNEEIEGLNETLTSLENAISAKEAELEVLKATLHSARDDAMAKESEVIDLTETVLELQESLEAKDKDIGHLNKEGITLEESEMDIQQLTESLELLHKDLDRAAEENDNLIAELKQEKAEKTNFIKFIEAELSDVKESDATAETRLAKQNSGLMQRLQEQTECYSEAMQVVAQLKRTVERQVCIRVCVCVCMCVCVRVICVCMCVCMFDILTFIMSACVVHVYTTNLPIYPLLGAENSHIFVQ